MKLVPDWKEAWKWSSMHAMGTVTALLAAWSRLPQKMQDALPVSWVIGLAVVILLLGMIGRLRDQSPKQSTDETDKAGA